MVMGLALKNCEYCGKELIIDPDGPYCMIHGKLFKKTSNAFKEKPAPAAGKDEAKNKKPVADLPPAIPQKPDSRNRVAVARYYDANKERIVADYNKLGQKEAAALWGINRSQFSKLLDRWGLKKTNHRSTSKPGMVKEPKRQPAGVLPPPTAPKVLVLPPLPEFNPAWPLETQRCWLEIYQKLTRRE